MSFQHKLQTILLSLIDTSTCDDARKAQLKTIASDLTEYIHSGMMLNLSEEQILFQAEEQMELLLRGGSKTDLGVN